MYEEFKHLLRFRLYYKYQYGNVWGGLKKSGRNLRSQPV
jgi:hypothetical protein